MSKKKQVEDEGTDKNEKAQNDKKFYPFTVRRQAYTDYMEDIPLDDICLRHDIVKTTLLYWIRTKGWKDKRDALQAKALQVINETYQDVIGRNQLKIIERKFKIGALLDRQIHAMLRTDEGKLTKLNAMQLKDISDAYSKTAMIDAKLAGLMTGGNQLSLIVGSGSLVNIGVSGQPVAALPGKEKTPASIEAEVSEPAYHRCEPLPCPF